MKYKTKPVIKEALQFIDSTTRITEISDWCGEKISIDYKQKPPVLKIETLEGTMIANVNDYIIKGLRGEFYPCKPDIFKKTYEKVKNDN